MSGDSAAIDAAALLVHAEGLRRLARRLVRDDAGADDLVQETYAAALRSGPPAGVEPRPWLFGMLKNLRRRAVRTDVRREAREARVARPESVAPDDAVVRAETHRRLVGEVIALPEPYRTTLVLRFLDGLEAAEIAARQGAPEATVRVRVHRGLALLRERLDAKRGGREAWVGAFAMAFGADRDASPPRTAAAAAPVVAKVAVTAVGLAAAAAGGWLVFAASGDRPEAAGAVETGAAPRTRAPRVRLEPEGAEPLPAVAATDPKAAEEALRARAEAALDAFFDLHLGLASKADYVALLDRWKSEGPAGVPVLRRMLERSGRVGTTQERALLDALVLLALHEIGGDDAVRDAIAATGARLDSEARVEWAARVAARSGPPDAKDVRLLGALARRGDAEADDALFAVCRERLRAPGRLPGEVGALASPRLLALLADAPAPRSRQDSACMLLRALAANPPAEAGLSTILETTRAWIDDARLLADAVRIAARLRATGEPPSAQELAASGCDAERAVKTIDAAALRAEPALLCFAHWAAQELATQPGGHFAAAFRTRLGREIAEISGVPSARTFLEEPAPDEVAAALRRVPWPPGNRRATVLAGGLDLWLASRDPRAPARHAESVRRVADAAGFAGTADRALAADAFALLAPFEGNAASAASILATPEFRAPGSGQAVVNVLRMASLDGRDAAFALHDTFLAVLREHPDESAKREAARLAALTARDAAAAETVVRAAVATRQRGPVEGAFIGLADAGRRLRDLGAERLGALVVEALCAPLDERTKDEILDEVEDFPAGRDAAYRNALADVLLRWRPESERLRKSYDKAVADLRKPPNGL